MADNEKPSILDCLPLANKSYSDRGRSVEEKCRFMKQGLDSGKSGTVDFCSSLAIPSPLNIHSVTTLRQHLQFLILLLQASKYLLSLCGIESLRSTASISSKILGARFCVKSARNRVADRPRHRGRTILGCQADSQPSTDAAAVPLSLV